MRISEAYAVLGHADKRARYDRDVLRRDPAPAHGVRPHGSYHSSNPAGGRPPSGLSRRRGTFQGPPPSFFRSGGWGAQSAKRRTQEGEGGGGPEPGAGTHPGMGPGQDPYGHRDGASRARHFDRAGHTRTHRAGDARRASRAADDWAAGDDRHRRLDDSGLASGFFMVSGILAFVILVPYWVLGGWWELGGGEVGAQKKKRPGA
jgi:hypothetical protein